MCQEPRNKREMSSNYMPDKDVRDSIVAYIDRRVLHLAYIDRRRASVMTRPTPRDKSEAAHYASEVQH